MSDLRVDEAAAADAPELRDVIHAAFAARPRVEPPTTALTETTESVARAIDEVGGLICRVDGIAAGALLFVDHGSSLGLRRVSVSPRFQERGVASAVVGVAEEVAAARGYDDVRLLARAGLPATLEFWLRRGYSEIRREQTSVTFAKALAVGLTTATADQTRSLGVRIGRLCRAGDIVLLNGELGAGKTTLAQGIGAGLEVRGAVTSPTFVIARTHPSLVGGPSLTHVDAYRLGGDAEFDDLDLDTLVDDAVTVVEWGEGLAEALSRDRLRVDLARGRDVGPDDESRLVTVHPVGARWVGAGVGSTLRQDPTTDVAAVRR